MYVLPIPRVNRPHLCLHWTCWNVTSCASRQVPRSYNWIMTLCPSAHITPHERTPFPSNSSVKLLKITFFNHCSTVCLGKTLVILKLWKIRISFLLRYLSSLLPRPHFILWSSPSLWICQSQSACWFIDFLEIYHSRTCLPLPSHFCPGTNRLGNLWESNLLSSKQPPMFSFPNFWHLTAFLNVYQAITVFMEALSKQVCLWGVESAHQNHFWDSHKPNCQRTIKNKSNGFRIIIFYYAEEAKGTATPRSLI